MKKILTLIFIMFSLFVLSNSKTFACSCMQPGSPSESKEMSTSVFIWTVSWVEEKNRLNQYDKLIVSFSWIKNIKWEYSEVKKISTAQSSATCWYNFEEWKEYIVYTNWEVWEESVSLCSRTSLTSNAQEDLEYFQDTIEEKEVVINENNDNKEVEKNKDKEKIIYLIMFLVLIALWLAIMNLTNKK